MTSNSLPSLTNENCSFFPKTHLVTSRDSTLYCLIARTVPHSFPGLKPVSIAVDHSQTISSSQCLERIHQTWPQFMEKGQSKKLVAWKLVLLALQIPTLPSFSFLMFLVRAHQDFFFFFNLLISIMACARFGFEITYNLIDVGF